MTEGGRPGLPIPKIYRICAIVGCGKTIFNRALCCAHYFQARKRGELPPRMVEKLSQFCGAFTEAQMTKIHRVARTTGMSDSAVVRGALDAALLNQTALVAPSPEVTEKMIKFCGSLTKAQSTEVRRISLESKKSGPAIIRAAVDMMTG